MAARNYVPRPFADLTSSVAVIGRTATEAGTNTECTSGRHGSFMPAICIS